MSPLLEDAYRRLLIAAEGDDWRRDGLEATPKRAASAWAELLEGYAIDPASLFTVFESDGYDELVLQRGISFYSICEHHLLPFHGTAAVGYIPAGGRIVGLSKLARLVHCFSRRLQNQERITLQIADALADHLAPAGVIVVLEAEHLCESMRGIKAAGATTITSAVRGVLLDKPEARAEALSLLSH